MLYKTNMSLRTFHFGYVHDFLVSIEGDASLLSDIEIVQQRLRKTK